MRFIKILAKALIVLIVIFVIGFTVFWFSRSADVSFEEYEAEIPHSVYSKFAEIDGVRLHFQEKGSGTPVVLIHGYASSTYTWKDIFEPLSEKFRVIAVDLKGFGFSEKPDGDYTRREQGRLINGLLEYLKVEKAWLVGNSMGGEISLNTALQNSGRVSGLILIDSAGVRFESRNAITPWYLDIPVLGRGLTALALVTDGLVREGLKKSYYDDAKISEERVKYYSQLLKTDNGQKAAILARRQSSGDPVEDKLGEIDLPTLIIWGAEDEVIPLEVGQKMNSLVKNSEMIVYEKVGHIPQAETPDKVKKDIIDFIEKSENSEN